MNSKCSVVLSKDTPPQKQCLCRRDELCRNLAATITFAQSHSPPPFSPPVPVIILVLASGAPFITALMAYFLRSVCFVLTGYRIQFDLSFERFFLTSNRNFVLSKFFLISSLIIKNFSKHHNNLNEVRYKKRHWLLLLAAVFGQ